MLCIFWGAILKCAGYVMGGAPGLMRIARGIPPTPTNLENKNEKKIKKILAHIYGWFKIFTWSQFSGHEGETTCNKGAK